MKEREKGHLRWGGDQWSHHNSDFCCVFGVGPLDQSLTSLGLSFSICKMSTIIPSSLLVLEIKQDFIYIKSWGTVSLW